MTRRGQGDVVAALDCLRKHNHFYQFDNQERVVEVSIYDAENADEVMAHLAQLRELQRLRVDRSRLTDDGLQRLRGHPTLRKLSITSPQITARGLSALSSVPSLRDLALLDAAGLDRSAFQELAKCAGLERLHVYHTNCGDEDVAPLGALANIEDLDLSQNDNMTGAYCQHFADFSRLKHFAPGEEHVTDQALVSISRLSTLEELFIGGPFTDAGLRSLSDLKQLRVLYVISEYVTDLGVSIIMELPAINNVGLTLPKLSDAGAAALARCQRLEFLSIFKSQLSARAHDLLRASLPDCALHLWDRDEE